MLIRGPGTFVSLCSRFALRSRFALLLWGLAAGCGAASIAGTDGGTGGQGGAGATATGGHPSGGAAGSGAAGSGTAGAAGSGAAGSGAAGGACVTETDAQFCARLGKTCEMVSGTDNCGAPRTAGCGTCAAGMGCVVNVCQTPVCTTFNYQATAFAAFSRAGQEDVMIAASPSGQSIAYAQSATGTCEMYTVYLADETAPDSGSYTSRDITSWIITNTVFHATGEMAALSGDGLTLVVISADQTK